MFSEADIRDRSDEKWGGPLGRLSRARLL